MGQDDDDQRGRDRDQRQDELQRPHEPEGLLDLLECADPGDDDRGGQDGWARSRPATRRAGQPEVAIRFSRPAVSRTTLLPRTDTRPDRPSAQTDHLAMDTVHDLVADLPDRRIAEGLEDPVGERRPDPLPIRSGRQSES